MEIQESLVGGMQAAKICGCSYRQIDYWVRSGLIPPPEVPAEGPGSRRAFSLLDLIRVRTIVELKKKEIPVSTIRRVLDSLTDKWRVADPRLSGQIMIVGDQLLWNLSGEQLLEVIEGQGTATTLAVLPIGEIVEAMRWRAIKASGAEYVA